MKYLTIALRLTLFLILFLFALKNHELATLRFYFDLEWRAPLVLLLLIFFAAGIAIGVLACLPRIFRQRRDLLQATRTGQQAVVERARVMPGLSTSGGPAATMPAARDASGSGS